MTSAIHNQSSPSLPLQKPPRSPMMNHSSSPPPNNNNNNHSNHSSVPPSPAAANMGPNIATIAASLGFPHVTPFTQTPNIDCLFIKKNLVGEGGYAHVYTAVNRKNGEDRAIKIMQRKKLSEKAKAMVIHEQEVLRRVSHPAIVTLHQCIQTETEVCFELDLMRTDLFEYIIEHKKKNEGKPMSEDDVAWVMAQLLSAVAYLHENNIVHRDIKPENILINSPSDIKLADFGLAKVVESAPRRNTPMGTSYYIAPEVIRSIEQQGATPQTTTRDAVKMVDIWACGVVIAFMLSGRPPFIGQIRTAAERRQLLNNIDRGVMFHDALWKNVSDEAKDLVASLLEQNLSKRITAAEALKHPFFENNGEKKWAKLYAHIPPRLDEGVQPIILEEGDEERTDVGLVLRAPTIVTEQRCDNFQTPSTSFGNNMTNYSYESALLEHKRGDSTDTSPLPGSIHDLSPAKSASTISNYNNASAAMRGMCGGRGRSGSISSHILASNVKNEKDAQYVELKSQLDVMHDELLADGDSADSGSESDIKVGSLLLAMAPGYSPASPRGEVRQNKRIHLPGQKPRRPV